MAVHAVRVIPTDDNVSNQNFIQLNRGKLEVKPSYIQYNPIDNPVTCSQEVEGLTYYDASIGELCDCNGSAWTPVDGSGTCA